MPTPTVRILLKDCVHPDPGAMKLCLDVGVTHLALSLHLISDHSLIGYEFYSFPENRNNLAELASALIESPLIAISVGHVRIVYNTQESVLVPDEMFSPEIAPIFLEVAQGDLTPGSVMLHEHYAEESICHVYRVPKWMQQELQLRFHSATTSHVMGHMLTSTRNPLTPQDGSIHLWFYSGRAIMLIRNNSKVVLWQSIPYDIPEDIIYAVLNTCEQYSLNPLKIPLYVCGLIEETSVLYVELMRHFSQVILDRRQVRFSQNDFFSSYPAHYFTPACCLEACES